MESFMVIDVTVILCNGCAVRAGYGRAGHLVPSTVHLMVAVSIFRRGGGQIVRTAVLGLPELLRCRRIYVRCRPVGR
jgi:hypothetical protein